MKTFQVSEADLKRVLGARAGVPMLAPTETPATTWMDVTGEPPSREALSRARSAQSPKGVFMPPTESVGRYGTQASAATQTRTEALVLVGMRACELRAQKYMDKVLLEGEFEDSEYRQRREAAIIISVDCVAAAETCFCTLVGGLPYPTDGFDINLTPIEGGYLLDVATERGERWLQEIAGQLKEATEAQIAERDRSRQRMVEQLRKQNAEFGFTVGDEAPPKMPDDDSAAWQQFACDCVECGGCTNVCPTCHCFYLYDQALGPEQFERLRTWDSCLLSTYHRMAGGVHMKLTPRPRLLSRLANRVLHKFVYSPQQYGMLGCVGCGRCIDACLGAIDIRRIVKELGE